MKQYGGLEDLLKKSAGAYKYYMSLPDDVQAMLDERGQGVCSELELRNMADNMIHFDR